MADLVLAAPSARFSLRGDAAAREAGCAAFGVTVPATLRAAIRGERAALWLGPDEITLLGPAGTPMPDGDFAIVDIGERQVAWHLTGRGGEAMLAAGCPLDLARFGVGGCTRTVLGKAEILLWRRAPFAWQIEVWRSFSGYVEGVLRQAAKDWL